MTYRNLATLTALLTVGCSGGTDAVMPPANACMAILGSGETHGDRNKLMGTGTFTFDGVQLTGQVGLYLFEMRAASNGGYDVDTQYQFIWDNGDSFLTSDKVFFEPGLEPDLFRFKVRMTIVSGTGRFAGHVGEQPIALNAEIRFGPPPTPADPKTADESFQINGSVCAP